MVPIVVQGLLFSFGLYHFLGGVFMLGPYRWMQGFGRIYSLKIPDIYEPRFLISSKFLGLMALMVSAVSWLLLIIPDHITQAIFLMMFAILFLARAALRWILKKEFVDAYQLEFKRSLKNIIFNIVLALFTFVMAYLHLKQTALRI